MQRVIILLFMLCGCGFTLSAQRVKKVSIEYTYHAPQHISPLDAKRIAVERAKMQAIADEFGTLVQRTNATVTGISNGKSSVDVYSFSESEVKGEWIETIGEPEFLSMTYEQDMLVITVKVEGRIREVVSATIDMKAKILRNGTEDKFESTEFRSGDDLYLSFQSPVDGYLAVYLLDEVSQMVYCLLPYKSSSEAITPIEHDKPYIFFSAEHAGDKAHLVDEYTMTCSRSTEKNTVYVVFSPNEFAKANSTNVEELLPQELPFEEFQKWLAKGRRQDTKMNVWKESITISEN